MSRRNRLIFNIGFLMHVVMFGSFLSFLPSSVYTQSDEEFYNLRSDGTRHYKIPRSYYGFGYLNSDPLLQEPSYHRNPAPLPVDEVFQIEPSDAIDGIKYSQPDIASSLANFKDDAKVPFRTFKPQMPTDIPNHNSRIVDDQMVSSHELSNKNMMKHLRDIRYLDSDEKVHVNSDNAENILANNWKNELPTDYNDKDSTEVYVENKNNFTDASENLVSVSSDIVLSYVPSDFNSDNSSVRLHSEIVDDVPSLNSSKFNESTLSPSSSESTISLNTHVYIEILNQTNFTDDTISSSIFPSSNIEENVTNSLPSVDSNKKLSSGTVAGIVIVVLVSVTLLSSAVIYLLYRKFNGTCTSVVESKFTTDNCGYLDDSLRSSIYLNNHIELPKESSEEMTSLDNDSFLNSLETMTIQNYWADNSKNTKV